jgi:hypothetical protein
VIRLGQLVRPPLSVRLLGLCVGAVLLGLLGMHGLGPVPAAAALSGHDQTAVGQASATAPMPSGCDHGGHGCTDHSGHAGPVCASASVTGAPAVVPVLVPDVVASGTPRPGFAPPVGSGPEGGRAPPSLSELQLLRI